MTIALERPAEIPDVLREKDFATDEWALLSVSDDGCGMDAELLENIFNPFFTTRQGNEGNGLGLSIVHSIIEQHEGFVSVSSEKGKGTTFSIYLPVLL